jgi:hypothetical protein
MQAHGAAQRGGVGTIPRRGGRWLEAVLTVVAILGIAALMALMTRGVVAPTDTSGVGAQDAKAGVVGSAIVHDDPGSVHSGLAPGYAPVHDDAGNMPLGTGSAIVHDDAGNMPATGAGAAVIHDDAGNVR